MNKQAFLNQDNQRYRNYDPRQRNIAFKNNENTQNLPRFNFQSNFNANRMPFQLHNENKQDNVLNTKKTFHQPPQANSFYKTQWCKKLRDSAECPFPNRCHYVHTKEEFRKPEDPFPLEYLKQIEEAQVRYYNNYFGNYKTMICRFVKEKKVCKYGRACNYAHTESELRKENVPLTQSEID